MVKYAELLFQKCLYMIQSLGVARIERSAPREI